ncbi:hypothetical protein QBC39DRAFT_337811 [Podospora conica]|nr:hypothetical protein QBC39DRAFT_337811 [Schizothecium conicum]
MAASKWSLTQHLLSTSQDDYTKATQHPFLLAAAEGRLSKEVLGQWLANDRLYIHSYIRAAGKLLASIDLPAAVPKTEVPETQLVDWLIEALAGVRREERFFIEVAERYGLGVELSMQTVANSHRPSIADDAKLTGLVMMEKLFGDVGQPNNLLTNGFIPGTLPAQDPMLWLEGAITFWGTERCYLDAWSWAKSKQIMGASGSDASSWVTGKLRQMVSPTGTDARKDADGGALRNEFIPNWSSPGFADFVHRLGSLVDSAVAQALERAGEDAEATKALILQRVEGKWKSLLAAEASFWPDVE